VSQAFIVGTGVDTLKINVKLLHPDGTLLETQEVPDELTERLQFWQEKARANGKACATTMTFHDGRIKMFPNGAPAWKYIVRNDCLEVKIGPRLHMPMVAKVTLTSAYLWEVGDVHQAVEEVHGFLIDLFGLHLALQAAQIDLCVDLVGLVLPTEWEQVFITHAIGKSAIGGSQKERAVYGGRKLETVNLSGHGCPVSCKIYDKTKEIRQNPKDKTWFWFIWRRATHADGTPVWNEDEQTPKEKRVPVWRVEFSLERAGLHELSLEGVDETIRNIKRIWAYCTRDWLRMVIPGPSKNRTRWVTHPTWILLQKAFDTYGDKEIDGLGPLVRERKRQANIEQGVAQIAGQVTTLAAYMLNELGDHANTLDMFNATYGQVLERWGKRGIDAQAVVEEKRKLYSQVP
jgi:hypothetical protein